MTNYDFDVLSGAGKFLFTFQNTKVNSSDEFEEAVAAVRSCDTIKFSSYITNEEALVLQKLKEKLGIKLVNDGAFAYQKFLENYSSVVGKSLYSGRSQNIIDCDLIIMVGTRISRDNPGVKYCVDQAIEKNSSEFIYMHPIDDKSLETKYTQFVKYEVGSEEAVLAMLAAYILEEKDIDNDTKEYLEDLDIGYLSGESSVGEEEYEDIISRLEKSKNKTLIIGNDIYAHSQAKNIAKLVGLIDKYSDFNIVLIPTCANTLGVSLLCALDEFVGDKVVGYNEKGDYTISSCGGGDFNTPSLKQQEGTFTTLDLKVVSSKSDVKFDGVCLNDIANKFLDQKRDNITDYTIDLAVANEFEAIPFDDLNGYYLKSHDKVPSFELDEVNDLGAYNGTVIYSCQSEYECNDTAGKLLTGSTIKTDPFLKGSNAFATAAKIRVDDTVNIIYNGKSVTKIFKIDSNLKGTVALYPSYDEGLSEDLLPLGYRYKQVKIEKVEVDE